MYDPSGFVGTVPPRKRRLWPWIVGGATVVVVAVVGGLVIAAQSRSEPDQHAITACRLLAQADQQSLIDAVVSEIKAIDEASKSTVADLRKATTTVSAASSLPPTDPRYRNPGDVQAAAIAEWCNRNRR